MGTCFFVIWLNLNGGFRADVMKRGKIVGVEGTQK